MSGAPYDENYWGPDGPDLARWGRGECMRGMQYKSVGAAPVAGAKNQRRTFGGARKERGSASSDLEKQEARNA